MQKYINQIKFKAFTFSTLKNLKLLTIGQKIWIIFSITTKEKGFNKI